jgi:hypothetical protein
MCFSFASISEAFTAFFEGFVGAESEIDALFEFEEADTALDRTDFPVPGSSDGTRSEGIARSALPQTPAGSSMPTPRPTPSIQIPPSSRSPRAKGNSVVGRNVDVAQSLTSPLAQIYMPVVLDEDTIGNAPEISKNLAPGISYGPARRRLTSTHRRPGSEIISTSLAQSLAVTPRKYSGSDSRKGVMDDIPISESPDTEFAAQRSSEKKLKTAAETEHVEETSGGAALAARLADIEKRQIRIEELLLKLVKQ